MAISPSQFARELRSFAGRREILNEVRRDIRAEVPPLRKEIREEAVNTLPRRNGLGAWVARAGVTVNYRGGRSAGFKLKVSRKSGDGDKADLKALNDTGKIRHPFFGDRSKWYPQTVRAGYFNRVWERRGAHMIKTVDDAMDRALDKIRYGR